MSWLSVVPREMVKRKPSHGSPCNRCGLCCVSKKCDLGAKIFGSEQGPCPALFNRGDGTYDCGVVRSPIDYDPVRVAIHGEEIMRNAALTLTRAGQGCDARINGEPINHGFNHKLDLDDAKHASLWKIARRVWGLKQAREILYPPTRHTEQD
jgi:hypothetical protein